MASLSDYVTPEQLMTSSNKATALEQNYQGLSSQASSLPVKLKAALQEHLGYNEDLAKMRADAVSGMTTARPDAQVKYAGIFDPFARSQLISQYVAQQQHPLTLANTLLDQRGQSVSDIVNATSGLFSGIVGAAQGDASAANNSYNRLYNMYQQGVAEQQAELQRQQQEKLAQYQQGQQTWENDYQNRQLAQQWNIANMPAKVSGSTYTAQNKAAEDKAFLQNAAQGIVNLSTEPDGGAGLKRALNTYISQRPDLLPQLSTLYEAVTGQNVGVKAQPTAAQTQQEVLTYAFEAPSKDEAVRRLEDNGIAVTKTMQSALDNAYTNTNWNPQGNLLNPLSWLKSGTIKNEFASPTSGTLIPTR